MIRPPKLWLPAFGIDQHREAWNPTVGEACPPGAYTLSRNIGDDIQTLAFERIARSAGLEVGFYERDTLERDGKWGSHGNVLGLVGWFSHSPLWPPPPGPWTPLFLGYHDSASEPNQRLAALRELADQSPWRIGCRDTHTAELFVRAGVPAERVYVSGCVTLTLPEANNLGPPLAVDVPNSAREMLRGISPVWEHTTHWMPEDVARDPVRRRKTVRKAIKRLAWARVVATTRLHAALPALASGHPVVFLRRDDLEARLEDYVSMFPIVRRLSDVKEPPVAFHDVTTARMQDDFVREIQRRSREIVAIVNSLMRHAE